MASSLLVECGYNYPGGNLTVSDSSNIQERHRATGRARQAAVAVAAFVFLLLTVLLGGLSLQGKGACSADERAVALRHERETLLARQLEQFSCIRQARVQLSPRSWQPGAVIVLEPVRPEAMPDAAALDRMLDALALVPDGPDKRHVLVFDPEGRRLYPADETDETALREQELALERQALRVLRPLLDCGRADVLVSRNGAETGKGRASRTVSVLLEEDAVPEAVRPHLEALLRQACALEEERGDTLRVCFLPARRDGAVLRGLALACLVLSLACAVAFFCLRRRGPCPSAPSGVSETFLPGGTGADGREAGDDGSVRQQTEACVREHPGHGAALLRHWLAQEDAASKGPSGPAGGQGPQLTGSQRFLLDVGEEVAAAMLGGMQRQEVTRITTAMACLPHIPESGVRATLREARVFLEMQAGGIGADRELAGRLLAYCLGEREAREAMRGWAPEKAVRPFETLERMRPGQLYQLLRQEHPQTLALILGHLSASQAVGLLMRLPTDMRSLLLEHIGGLAPVDADILDEMDRVLARQAAERSAQDWQPGLQVAAEIVAAAGRDAGTELLSALEKQASRLPSLLGRMVHSPEDCLTLEDGLLEEALEETSGEALAGVLHACGPAVRTALLEHVPEARRSAVERRLRDGAPSPGQAAGYRDDFLRRVRQLQAERMQADLDAAKAAEQRPGS